MLSCRKQGRNFAYSFGNFHKIFNGIWGINIFIVLSIIQITDTTETRTVGKWVARILLECFLVQISF